MPSTRGTAALAILAAVLLGVAPQAQAQSLPAGITEEQLANDNNLFLALAKKALHWEEPAEPVKISGPLYFVGTKGLGVFLFATPEKRPALGLDPRVAANQASYTPLSQDVLQCRGSSKSKRAAETQARSDYHANFWFLSRARICHY